jgi:hypothetical protein
MLEHAKLAERVGWSVNMVIGEYLAAYNFRPIRLEALYHLTRFLRQKSVFVLGVLFGEQAVRQIATGIPDILFVDVTVSWRVRDELALCYFYTGKKDSARYIWEGLLGSALTEGDRQRTIDNIRFCGNKIEEKGDVFCRN